MEKKRDLKGLISTLDHKDSTVRCGAVDALVRIGTPAVGPVAEALRGEGDGAKWELVVTLRRIREGRAVEPLIQTLKDEDRRVRIEAMEALGEIGDVRAVEPLVGALKDAYSTVRMSAADALGRIGDAGAVEPLFQSVWDEDVAVRERAAEALGKMGETAVTFLVQALKGENREARQRAVWALEKIGWQPRDDAERAHYLITRASELGKKEWDELALIREPAVEPLIYVLGDERVSVRRAAVEALRKIGSGRSRGGESYLFDEAGAGDPAEIRAQVVEALVKALRDEDVRVCEEAAKALSSIGDLGAAEAILDWLFLFGQSPIATNKEELDSWIGVMRSLFGDYTPVILRASMYIQSKAISLGKDSGEIHHSLDETKAAIHELFEIRTQISDNILHKISQRKDVRVTTSWDGDFLRYGTLSFEAQRRITKQELERRENPPYNPSEYLDKDAWKLSIDRKKEARSQE